MIEIRDAETILVPKGERYNAVAAAASEEFGIDFPPFPEGEDTVKFDGREYRRADDADIPELVSRGAAHIGFAGLDSCTEANADVAFRSFGQPFAFFDLLGPAALADQTIGKLAMSDEPLAVRTRYPRLLGSGAVRKGVKLAAVDDESDTHISADVVPAGSSAAEGTQSILRLREIRPAVVLPRGTIET